MKESSNQIEEQKVEVNSEIEKFFENGKFYKEEELQSKDEFKLNIKHLVENNLKYPNIYFVLFETTWFKDQQYFHQIVNLICENKDFKFEFLYRNFLFITNDNLVFENFKNFNKSDILIYFSMKNKAFPIDFQNNSDDEDDFLNEETNEEQLENENLISEKKKFSLPIINRLKICSISHNSIIFSLPEVTFAEFRKKNSYYSKSDDHMPNYIVLLSNYKSKKFKIAYNDHYKEKFEIEGLEPEIFYTIRIVIYYKVTNSYSQSSRPFYFFTKTDPDKPKFSFYSWGVNKCNITFSEEENKFQEIKSPLKYKYSDIRQIIKNKDNCYLLLTNGLIISNGQTYCDQNGNNEFDEINSLSVKSVLIGAFNFPLKDLIVRKIACGRDSLAMLTTKGRLYTYGLNDAGQLGLNYPNEIFVNSPKEVKFPGEGGLVIDIAGGEKHYLALFKNINTFLYTWGLNQGIEPLEIVINLTKEFPLSHKFPLSQSKIPVQKNDFIQKNIIKIYAKGHYSAIFTLEKFENDKFRRNVYTFGQNTTMLGNVDICANSYVNIPRKVESLKNNDIIDISFGENHTLFLVNKKQYTSKSDLLENNFIGSVYGCGMNMLGELGTIPNSNYDQPFKLNHVPENIKGISAGENSSVLIDEKNSMYFLGKNSLLFCGNPQNYICNSIVKNEFFEMNNIDVVKVYNFDNTCCALIK